MNPNECTAELYRQQFAVEVSKRYHAHRIDALVRCSGGLQVVELVASTAALISTFAWSISITRGMIFLAGLSAGLAMVKRLQARIAYHYAKKAAFADLSNLFPVDLDTGTDEQLKRIVEMRNQIEQDDTTGFPCLDIICHNEVCLSLDREAEMQPLTWIQAHLGTRFPIPYHPAHKQG